MSVFMNTLLSWIESSRYILLFLGAIFEGPVLMVASGFLYRLGTFDLIPMYIALLSGDFVADISWYFIGRFGGRPIIDKYGHWFNITSSMVDKIEERFHRYHEKILIISKLTMGFGFALVTLLVAGLLRVPFRKYVTLNLIGGFIWTAFLISIGYFFGNIYASIPGWEKILFACGILICVVIIFNLANRYMAKQNI